MQGFFMLTAHMLGDFILQNDWIAARKSKSHFACAVHCLIYTLVMGAFTWHFMPWWTLPLVFGTHYVVDRWWLARKAMTLFKSDNFATKPFAPWSVVVVDQTIHFTTLCWIYLLGTLGEVNYQGSMITACVVQLTALACIAWAVSHLKQEPEVHQVVVSNPDWTVADKARLREALEAHKTNTAVVPGPLEPGETISGVVVETNRGFVIDYPYPRPFPAVRRLFVPVLPGDTLETLESRLRAIVNLDCYLEQLPAMVERLRERYNLWKQNGDFILDVTAEANPVVVADQASS